MPDQGPVAVEPAAPLGHLSHLGFALVGARSVDEVADCLLTDLAALPGVTRIGFALTEGGGRRLRFTASDREREHDALSWCHIDAYDDVPLTRVVRSGEAVLGSRDVLASRWPSYVDGQPDQVRALAALPLPGVGSPIGGIVVFLEEVWDFSEAQRRLLEAAARRAAEAVRRLRAAGDDEVWDDEGAEAVQPDDATEAAPPTGAVSARVLLDDDPRSAGVARRFLRDFLAGAEVGTAVGHVDDDVADSAQLCLSELVTNALVHATSRTEVRADLDPGERTLTVTVRDRGAEGSAAGAPAGEGDPLRVHGRGLQLVEALADRWGSQRRAGGTTVWFTLGLEPAAGLPSSGSSSRTG